MFVRPILIRAEKHNICLSQCLLSDIYMITTCLPWMNLSNKTSDIAAHFTRNHHWLQISLIVFVFNVMIIIFTFFLSDEVSVSFKNMKCLCLVKMNLSVISLFIITSYMFSSQLRVIVWENLVYIKAYFPRWQAITMVIHQPLFICIKEIKRVFVLIVIYKSSIHLY